MSSMQILIPACTLLPWENIEELGMPKSPSGDDKRACSLPARCERRPELGHSTHPANLSQAR